MADLSSVIPLIGGVYWNFGFLYGILLAGLFFVVANYAYKFYTMCRDIHGAVKDVHTTLSQVGQTVQQLTFPTTRKPLSSSSSSLGSAPYECIFSPQVPPTSRKENTTGPGGMNAVRSCNYTCCEPTWTEVAFRFLSQAGKVLGPAAAGLCAGWLTRQITKRIPSDGRALYGLSSSDEQQQQSSCAEPAATEASDAGPSCSTSSSESNSDDDDDTCPFSFFEGDDKDGGNSSDMEQFDRMHRLASFWKKVPFLPSPTTAPASNALSNLIGKPTGVVPPVSATTTESAAAPTCAADAASVAPVVASLPVQERIAAATANHLKQLRQCLKQQENATQLPATTAPSESTDQVSSFLQDALSSLVQRTLMDAVSADSSSASLNTQKIREEQAQKVRQHCMAAFSKMLHKAVTESQKSSSPSLPNSAPVADNANDAKPDATAVFHVPLDAFTCTSPLDAACTTAPPAPPTPQEVMSVVTITDVD